ncbi:MAG: hypothetical protein KDB74_05480 [Flavobacteriales bacterium]|nr:hypothetical protein [Flavobacteriales bacterium]
MEYPWYEQTDNNSPIEQGEFVLACPIVIPPENYSEGETIDVQISEINCIILSQSCDLQNGKLEIALVCPFFSLQKFIAGLEESGKNSSERKKTIENLRKGILPGYHLLNKVNINEVEDYYIVDFRNVYGVHMSSLLKLTSKSDRIRVLPPYREHLSQAFARFFMRVGLPQDIKIEKEFISIKKA